jgi:hypothetical protein
MRMILDGAEIIEQDTARDTDSKAKSSFIRLSNGESITWLGWGDDEQPDTDALLHIVDDAIMMQTPEGTA